MISIKVVCAATVVIYLVGECLGLLLYCENDPNLQDGKKYVVLVPVIKLMYIIHCVKESIVSKHWKTLFHFCFFEANSLVCLYGILYAIKELEKEKKRKYLLTENTGCKKRNNLEQMKRRLYVLFRELVRDPQNIQRFHYN